MPQGKEDTLSLLQDQTAKVEMFRKGKRCSCHWTSPLWMGYPEKEVSYWTHVTSARPWLVSWVTQGILSDTWHLNYSLVSTYHVGNTGHC